MSTEKAKILIVDDDPFIREILAAILEGEGYAVVLAENGTGAFKAFFTDSGIGLVISDMIMPDMNGLELIKKIRGRGSDVPAIILTGDAEMLHDLETLEGGVCDILIKDENIQEAIGSFVSQILKKYAWEKKKKQ